MAFFSIKDLTNVIHLLYNEIGKKKKGEKKMARKKRTEEITIPDSLFFYINEALEEYLNKNLMGKDLEKVVIKPGKDFNSYKMKFYYLDNQRRNTHAS